MVGVGPLGAGGYLGPQAPGVQEGQVSRWRPWSAHSGGGPANQVGDSGQLPDARGVSQQVTEGDLRSAGRRIDAEGLEVGVDGVVEPEEAVFVQLHQAHRGQRLGDRSDAEHRVGTDGPACCPVGKAETLGRGRLTRANHGDGEPSQAVTSGAFDHDGAQVGHWSTLSGAGAVTVPVTR